MRETFFSKLALENLKRNRKTYFPFLLTCIGTVLMFYNVCALSYHTSMQGSSVQIMLQIGMIVTAVFSVIFEFYTNSFLIKRRKKEFGLFHILGMEKKHIAKIMLWEKLLTAIMALAGGLLLGIIFSKLITLVLYKMLHFNPNIAFEISLTALLYTIVLFGAIFLLMLLHDLRQVYTTRPIELLQGGSVGECEPKANWLLALAGVLSLGAGYGLALTIQEPLAVIGAFFAAVLFVMAGTYFLFTAGSIALLKLLRRNKKFYYQTRHFVSLSSMIYRMKQNAAGLANICIMSTAVLVMISTTVSMYVGMEDLLSNRFPRDMLIQTRYTPDTKKDYDVLAHQIDAVLSEHNVAIQNRSAYRYLSVTTERNGNDYAARAENFIANEADFSMLIALSAADYEALSGETVTLSPDEALVHSIRDEKQITLLGKEYNVRGRLAEISDLVNTDSWMVDQVYVVLPEEADLFALYEAQKQAYGDKASSLRYQFAFDFTLPEAQKNAFVQQTLLGILKGETFAEYAINIESKQMSRGNFFELYGGLLFLGIFLGALFLMATVLIIYYKQVVEGFDDKARFEIMQKVGMSHAEVRHTVRSQILMVFLLPLVMAGVHIAFAFPILVKLLIMMNLTNVQLFAYGTLCTLLVFATIYALVYAMTARVYYRIVNGESRKRVLGKQP